MIITLYCFHSISNIFNVYTLQNTFFYIIAAITIIFFIVKVNFVYLNQQKTKQFKPRLFSENTIFTIDQMGACQFSVEDIRQLSIKSKISWLGVYVLFEENDNLPNNHLTSHQQGYFLYKDRFSKQDYARLSRIILYCQKKDT